MSDTPIPKGRGTPLKPQNRFEKVVVEDDWEQLEYDEDHLAAAQHVPTKYLADDSKSIISENDSPDIPFRYSLNPFRGCSHGWMCCAISPRSPKHCWKKGLRRKLPQFAGGGQ